MDEKKKEFIKPLIEIVCFDTDDIITYSVHEDAYTDNWFGEDWGDE